MLQFDPLRLVRRGVQTVRDVLCGQVAPHDEDRGEDVPPLAVDRDVGGSSAEVDEHHAQIHLVLVEDRLRRGQRLEHHLHDVEAGATAALDDVVHGGRRGRQDVRLDLHANSADPHGIPHLSLAVDDVLEGKRVDDSLVEGDVHRLRLLDHAPDVLLRDLPITHGHLAKALESTDVPARDAHVDGLHIHASHLLRHLHGLLDGVGGGLDVDHDALPEAIRAAGPDADHLHALLGHLADHGCDLRRPDVQSYDEGFIFGHGYLSLSGPWGCASPGPLVRRPYHRSQRSPHS